MEFQKMNGLSKLHRNGDSLQTIKITVEKTKNPGDARKVYRALAQAFEPFRQFYTKKAFEATILSPELFEDRIINSEADVLVAVMGGSIAGTASVKLENERNLYLCSMGVKPEYQKKGVGFALLEEVEADAKRKQCRTISLETYPLLTKAIALYERFGFRRTGRTRDYYGVTIFEMKKEVE
jgi:ribosomal protein S18 acetylase RimI-like enzyme